MPSPPRTRTASRLAALAGLAAGLLAVLVGCETVRPDSPHDAAHAAAAGSARGAEPSGPPAAQSATHAPPGKHATRRGYYVFYHDFELDPADPLFAELEALPDQVFGELRLPPGNTVVQVFLFDTQDRYERYMRARYRDLPNRRAYMIAEPRLGGGPDELKVFTWMGDHLRTDLRHELTHALLRAVLKEVPLWLDEGLAGFFELPPDHDGVNANHLEILRRGPFQPDLTRLERLDKVRQMEKPEYREAWAWVHLMLRGSPEAGSVLRDYLQALRTSPNPGPLLPRLKEVLADPDHELAEHLARLAPPAGRPSPKRR
jgi:hypothetical protein